MLLPLFLRLMWATLSFLSKSSFAVSIAALPITWNCSVTRHRGEFPLGDQAEIFIEHILRIPWTTAGFRVELDGHYGQAFMHHPFHRAVVQVDMRDAQPAARNALRVDGIRHGFVR